MSDVAEPIPGIAQVRSTRPLLGYALYLLAATLFAINGTVSKALLLTGIDSTYLSQLRVTLAFLILFAFVAITRPRSLRIRRDEIGILLAYGVLGVAMTQYLYFLALETLPVGIALLIEFTAPIMVALWFHFGLRLPTPRIVWLGLFVALAGLAMVAEVWKGFTLDPMGVTAAFGAAAALAIFFLLGDAQVRRPDPRDAVSMTMWGFGAATLFWVIVKPWWLFPWGELAGTGYPLGADSSGVPIWMLVTSMVVLGTVAPFWLIVMSLHHIRASRASVIGMTEPLLATFIAWLALGEVLAPAQIVGAIVVLIGVYLAERYRT